MQEIIHDGKETILMRKQKPGVTYWVTFKWLSDIVSQAMLNSLLNEEFLWKYYLVGWFLSLTTSRVLTTTPG